MKPLARLGGLRAAIETLGRIAKYSLAISGGVAMLLAILVTNAEFTLNRDAEYCDYYEERLIYYAKDDCHVIVPAVAQVFVAWLAILTMGLFVPFFAICAAVWLWHRFTGSGASQTIRSNGGLAATDEMRRPAN